jgi:hypothetical protein
VINRRILSIVAFVLLVSLLAIPVSADEGEGLPTSSSTDTGPVMPIVMNADGSDVITFDEYAVGTDITDQYQDDGIIFGGYVDTSGALQIPYIIEDAANPTSPVLANWSEWISWVFGGDITGTFVEPGTYTPTIVSSFEFDAGYFDALESTDIEWFDPYGNSLGVVSNSQYGIEQFNIAGGPIASWLISGHDEPAGFGIDNVSIVPFIKVYKTLVDAWPNDDPALGGDDYIIDPGEDWFFEILIQVHNPSDVDVTDVLVKDNLGGDLELIEAYGNAVGTVATWTTGKTEKVHMVWEDIGTLAPGDVQSLTLVVSTDINTGDGNGKKPKGHQEYTSEPGTVHELNSGATARGNVAFESGVFEVSDTSDSIEVEIGQAPPTT